MHATRFRRTGSTDDPTPRVEDRFWAKVDRSEPNGCWRWLALRNHGGYGRFWFEGKQRQAHRVAYVLFVGPIPDGFDIDHLCHNRSCVRPEHLEAVSPEENTRRRRAFLTANGAKRACPAGHPYNEGNTYWRTPRHRECRACRSERSSARRRKS